MFADNVFHENDDKGGAWVAKSGAWHWHEALPGGVLALRSRCGNLVLDSAEELERCRLQTSGPVIGWPCRVCLRLLDLDAAEHPADTIARLEALLDVLTDDAYYDAGDLVAAKDAYRAHRAGKRRGRGCVVRLEPGVWLTDGDGDPPRTLQPMNAKIYTAREARRALAAARRYRPFRLARVLPATVLEDRSET
jgi:hypothetical protein